MASENEYVLGTHDQEIQRLGLQHRVWRPRALDAWRRAGFTVGHLLMDVGCGPGEASIDLAGIVGSSGRVIAVDKSKRFLKCVDARRTQHGITNIETHLRDLDTEDLPDLRVDGAWTRWVFAFVQKPRLLLERLCGCLKTGGAVVIHEYFDYRTWRLAPECPEFEEFVAAVIRSWKATGGDPDIGLRLPGWLEELGFELQCTTPLIDVVPPSNYIWHWPKSFLYSGSERLVELGYLSARRAAEILKVFEAAEARHGTRMITPGVLEIIAVRRD